VADPPEAVPDGLTVDAEGCIWCALWNGWRIVRFDPKGQVMSEIRVPVQRVTACTFGGPELDTLYITTAWNNLTPDERAAQPQAGDLFQFQPGVKGMAESRFGV
jgi:sugar lactone lactonase YvrE